jgi:hypothetical protein
MVGCHRERKLFGRRVERMLSAELCQKAGHACPQGQKLFRLFCGERAVTEEIVRFF